MNKNLIDCIVSADEPMFSCNNGILLANIPKDAAGQTSIRMAHRTTILMDCGFSIKIPPGYTLKVALTQEFATKGLMIIEHVRKDDRVKVLLINIGKELVVINKGDNFANAWLESMYFWKEK